MTDFASPWRLVILVAVVAVVAAVRVALARRRHSLDAIAAGEADRSRRIARGHALRAAIVVAALALIGVALARPRWGERERVTSSRGADVVVAIDVSLSMLAEDARPSRIERAKLLVRDLVPRLAGDRVGLVGFAGSSAVLLPLSLDGDAVLMFSDDLEAQSVDEPGTAIERAVGRAVEMFDRAGSGERVLVVLSDGEDQSSDPLAAASSAAETATANDVHVVAVAIGSDDGVEIPLDVSGGKVVKRDAEGRPVVTRARRDVLATLAANGLFVDADRGDEAERVADYVDARASAWEREEAERERPERFQTLLAAAFALLAVEYLWSSWRR